MWLLFCVLCVYFEVKVNLCSVCGLSVLNYGWVHCWNEGTKVWLLERRGERVNRTTAINTKVGQLNWNFLLTTLSNEWWWWWKGPWCICVNGWILVIVMTSWCNDCVGPGLLEDYWSPGQARWTPLSLWSQYTLVHGPSSYLDIDIRWLWYLIQLST